MAETAERKALIEKLAHGAVKNLEDDEAGGWLRSAVRMVEIEANIRKAIRAALRTVRS